MSFRIPILYRVGVGNINYGEPSSSGGGGVLPAATIQYGWVVGGASNFAALPGSPTPPIAGANLSDAGLVGKAVRVSRNGQVQSNYNPANGNTFYTKVLASNTVVFTPAIGNGEELFVETIPI